MPLTQSITWNWRARQGAALRACLRRPLRLARPGALQRLRCDGALAR